MNYSIPTIAKIIRAESNSVITDQLIEVLLTDSRSLIIPEKSLFFALKTTKNDGRNYIEQLYRKGVRAFVVSSSNRGSVNLSIMDKASFLWVKDPLAALQRISTHHRKRFQIPVIGITGSNGKTIVKEWLYQLLHENYKIVRSPRSFNSQIGVPLSVWKMDEKSELAIFEAGISEVAEMCNLHSIIKPTVGILTNIGVAHQDGFESMQQKCFEKLKLFQGCEMLIYDADNPLIVDSIEKSNVALHEIAWSKKNKDRPLYISKIKKTTVHTQISYVYIGISGSFTIPFTDEASIENAIHCLAVMLYLSYSADTIAQRMEQLEPVAMRMEVKEGINQCILINDSYTSDVQSLDIALDFMMRRAMGNQMKKTIILSDILQTGTLPKFLYKQVSELLRNYSVDRLIGIGPEISSQQKLFNIEKEFYLSTESFLQAARWDSFHKEMVLLKGSRSFHLEDISENLERKVHETILEVNLDALVYNFNFYKSKLTGSTKMICMVKAFGYGTGSIEIGKTLQEHGCDYLAVATADEGMELRKAGVYIPIIVMNPEFGSLHTLFNYSLEPEVYSFKLLKDLIQAANRHGISNFPIHIKINTGMNRLGFVEEQIPELVLALQHQTALQICSVFSHLMASDDCTQDNLTRLQIERFAWGAEQIRSTTTTPILRHILNTAGIVRFTESQMEMVRLGIGLYGVATVGESELRNVSTLKTNILQIQQVKAGSAVGYSGKNRVSCDSKVAIIPIGYADGLDRKLSNGIGEVLVKGTIAPIIGNICMDISMIDVTNIDEVQEGDEVVVFGDNHPINEMANRLKTIPYEILTSISERVKRIYIKE